MLDSARNRGSLSDSSSAEPVGKQTSHVNSNCSYSEQLSTHSSTVRTPMMEAAGGDFSFMSVRQSLMMVRQEGRFALQLVERKQDPDGQRASSGYFSHLDNPTLTHQERAALRPIFGALLPSVFATSFRKTGTRNSLEH